MKRLILLLTITLFAIGSSLNAQPHDGNSNKAKQKREYNMQCNNSGSHLEKMQQKLNLSNEQIKNFNEITFEHQNFTIDLKSKIQKNKLIVKKMMQDNNVDKDNLLKITKQNNEFLGEIKLSKTNMWFEVYNLLDDTQKAQWTKTFVKFSSRSQYNKQRRN